MARVCAGVSRCLVSATSFPLTRARKTSPALMWRSLAPRSTAALMIFSIPELPVSCAMSARLRGEEAHPLPHALDRLLRGRPRLRGAEGQRGIDLRRVGVELGGLDAHRR